MVFGRQSGARGRRVRVDPLHRSARALAGSTSASLYGVDILHNGRVLNLVLRLFTNATSLGGCESLIEHRASVEGANPRSPQNLLRMSVGLEDGDDLVADLAQALG